MRFIEHDDGNLSKWELTDTDLADLLSLITSTENDRLSLAEHLRLNHTTRMAAAVQADRNERFRKARLFIEGVLELQDTTDSDDDGEYIFTDRELTEWLDEGERPTFNPTSGLYDWDEQ